MPAYLKPIERPRCRGCERLASLELVSGSNDHLGFWCSTCGRNEIRSANKIISDAHATLGAAKTTRIP